MAIRILLADDHVLVRQGIRVLLEQAGMVVVGEAADGPEALRLAHTHAPAVALLDIAMPHLNGLEDGPPAAGDRAPDQDHPADDAHGRALRPRSPARRGGRLCREDAGGGGSRAGHPHRGPRCDLSESVGHDRGGAGLCTRDTAAAGPADVARARGRPAHRGGADDQGDRGRSGAGRQNRRVASDQPDAEAGHP